MEPAATAAPRGLKVDLRTCACFTVSLSKSVIITIVGNVPSPVNNTRLGS